MVSLDSYEKLHEGLWFTHSEMMFHVPRQLSCSVYILYNHPIASFNWGLGLL